MEAHECTRKIRLTVLKASHLRIHQIRWKPPKCFYSLSIGDSLPTKVSKLAESWNPTWDEGYELDQSSVVRLAVYQRSLLRPRVFLGDVVLRIEDLMQGRSDLSDHELSKRGSTQCGRYGKLTIFLQLSGGPNVTFTSCGGLALLPGPQEAGTNFPVEPTTHSALNLLNTQVTEFNLLLPSSDSFSRVCGYVEKLVHTGDMITKINPWASLAWTILGMIPKSLIAQFDRDQRIQQLWAAAADMLDFLNGSGVILDSVPVPIVDAMMKQIYDCALFVREYAGRGFLKRTLRNSLNSSCDRIVSEYIDALRVLKEQFMCRSLVATFITCRDIKFGVLQLHGFLEDMKGTERSKLLDGLLGASVIGARCDESYICLPGTRTSLLNDVTKWINDPDGARLFWLHGVAGSGKSMIANTITAQFTQLGRMGASFRFNRAVDGRNSSAFVIGNIAYQLAHNSPQYKSALLRAIEKYGTMSAYSSLKDQFRKYVIEPLAHLDYSGPLVIILDALDEIGTGSVRDELLETLTVGASLLPAYIRLLLVSRDEIDIRGFLAPDSHLQSMNDVLETSDDILVFIAHELLKVRQRHTHLTLEWPGPAAMAELGRRADGLFIWAAIACDYVRRSLDPDVSLRQLLSVGESNTHRPRLESKLDQLYLDILCRAMADHPLSEATTTFQYVMGSVVTLKTLVARATLDSLLGLGRQEIRIWSDGLCTELTTSETLLASLGSIIRRDGGLVRVIHTSIIDFLTNNLRCNDRRFYVDLSKQNLLLASRCLRSMSELKSDICNIKDSTRLNAEVLDLDERLEKCLPGHVRYASQFWHKHLIDTTSPDNSLYEDIKTFLFSHLLHWMEVMSLLNCTDTIISALGSVKTWVDHHFPSVDDTAQLIGEALRFIQLFHEPIKQSAAHVYVSALPFTSHDTILFRLYAPCVGGIPKALSNPGPSQYLMTLPHKQGHLVAPIKRDGSLFAYTDDGKTIQLWDVVTCLPVAQLRGHSARVSSVVFSSDEKIIASGDEQGVIIIWDASTYTPIGAPLSRTGKHPAGVETISISGNKIVAHYEPDCAVVWDIDRRELLAQFDTLLSEGVSLREPLQGRHLLLDPGSTFLIRMSKEQENWRVEAVVDSVTGDDLTLRYLKDSKTLKCLLVSPDNKVVVTIDEKNAIRVLDAASGEMAGSCISLSDEATEPMIKFSGQNGRRLIVAIPGGHIHIYDYDGECVAGPMEVICSSTGADEGKEPTLVTAATLSFDETRLVASTSENHGNILIWDVASAQLVATFDYFRTPFPQDLSLSPDNSKVVLSGLHGVVVWHVEISLANGIESSNRPTQSPVTTVIIAPCGKSILVGLEDGSVILYHDWEDVTSRSLLVGGTFPACFSPDATIIVTSSGDFSLLRWDTSNCKPVGSRWRGHQGAIMSTVFWTDKQVLSLSKDQTIRTWDLESGKEKRAPMSVSSSMKAITLSKDRSWIVGAYEPDVELVVDDRGRTIGKRTKDHSWMYAEFMSGGREIVCSTKDGHSRRLDCETGKLLEEISIPGPRATPAVQNQGRMSHYKKILPTDFWDSVTTSPDGKWVAYMTYASNEVHIGLSSDGSSLCPPLHLPHDTMPTLFFSPDSTRLAALFPGGDAQIWNLGSVPTRKVIPAVHTYPPDRIRAVDQIHGCCPDGWLRGEQGLRLLWLPDGLRYIWVVTPEGRGRRAFVAGREQPVVIDMEDLLKTLTDNGGWRAGGVQYIADESHTALALDRNAAYVVET